MLGSFSGKDGVITDPWHQLFQLINAVADGLQWNIGRLFSGDRYLSLDKMHKDKIFILALLSSASELISSIFHLLVSVFV